MLDAIKQLGQFVIEKHGKDALDILVEDPDSTGNYTRVITIEIKQNKDDFILSEVGLEKYDKTKKLKYLYRKGAANGADFSPTAKLSDKPKGTFDRKILGWFKILDKKKVKIDDADRDFLENIREVLEENADEIKEKIVNYRDSIPKKEGMLVTLEIIQNGEAKYVGDFPVFRELLIQQVKEKDEKISAKQKICSLCGKHREKVLGNIDTYAFYTIDKPGYITGNFDKKKSWRNFPVCPECKLKLDEGKRFVEENLTFKFCGIRYNLIPKFIVGTDELSEYVIDIFTDTSKLVSLKQERVETITDDEEEILDLLKDVQDIITLNFLFIQKSNAAERILLVIEDVFPSRLRQIFDAKYRVDEIYDNNFTFRTIRNFFFKSDKNKRNSDLDKYFLDIVDKVFKDRPISYHFILKFIMKKIRDEFINDGYFNFAVRDGLMMISFLEELKLFKMEEEQMEDRIFDELFEKYGPTFQTPLKRGLFLLGTLTELLLRKQYNTREAKPFLSNLKSLKMTERDFKGLLPKVQNKLEEYESFDKGKRIVAREASHYLLMSGEDWKMPVDELNFYFVSGMNLADEVTKIIYSDKDKQALTEE